MTTAAPPRGADATTDPRERAETTAADNRASDGARAPRAASGRRAPVGSAMIAARGATKGEAGETAGSGTTGAAALRTGRVSAGAARAPRAPAASTASGRAVLGMIAEVAPRASPASVAGVIGRMAPAPRATAMRPTAASVGMPLLAARKPPASVLAAPRATVPGETTAGLAQGATANAAGLAMPAAARTRRGVGAPPRRADSRSRPSTSCASHAFAQDVIASTIDTSKIAREERAFATRLVLGVTSTRGTLDDVIDGCMDSPDDASPAVRDALALSAYEIIFLQKSPHAAVDQGVELVKSVAPRAGGLANAVLRRVVRAKESFPFGDPRTDLRAYARLHGFPAWLAERLIKDLGPQGAHDLMTASNEPAPVYVAVNAAKATDEEVVSILAAAHGQPEPVEVAGRRVEGCYRLASGLALLDGRVRRMLSQGLLLVSDATSQAVASLVVGEEEPASFLEIGAGRATKTILDQSCAQRRFGHQVSGYVTVDAHAFKTKLLRERAAQFDIEVEDALTGDGCDLGALVGERLFDRVFVDAPCTGLGTLRRHADIRWRLRPDTIAEQAALGARLLDSAAAHVAPGGTLAYATCTVTTEENAAVVEAFLASEQGAGFEIIPFARPDLGVELPFFSVALEPGGPDAHFLALLRRRS